MSGPCIYCGAINYTPSMGGPMICPSCDCGNFGPSVVQRQGETITNLRAQLATARKALEPFVAHFEKEEARYKKRGGDPAFFGDDHPSFDTSADTFSMGVWRKARAVLYPEKSAEQSNPDLNHPGSGPPVYGKKEDLVQGTTADASPSRSHPGTESANEERGSAT